MKSHRSFWFALVAAAMCVASVRAATLIHRYDFNGATVADLVGSADGTLFGDAVVSGGALRLDGNGDYVEFATPIVPVTGTWSVAFFGQQTGVQGGIVEMISGGSTFYIGHAGNRTFRFSDRNLSTSVPFPGDGQRHHYAWVQGPANGTFYIDGTAVGAFASMSPNGVIRLGRQYGSNSEWFLGNLDDLAVFSGVLGPDEVSALATGAGICVPAPAGLQAWYRGEDAADDRLGVHHAIPEGGVGYAAGKVGRAFQFNGTDAALDVGTWFNRQVFSIAFWVNPAETQQSLADILDNNHSSVSWVLQQSGSEPNHYGWSIFDGSAPVFMDLPANTWSHVVITRDSDRVNRIYLEGTLVGSEVGTGDVAYDGSEQFRVGRWGSGGRHWNGLLDELDVYDRALTEDEVRLLHAAGAAGKCLSEDNRTRVPYFTDFESGLGQEWSISALETSHLETFTRFTGRFNNHSQTLTLSGFVPGQSYTLGFDFYAIDSWDGNGGNDRFQVLVNGQSALDETFSNYNGDPPSNPQSYAREPDGGRVHHGFHGSYVDAIYRNIELPFVPPGSTVQLTFRGFNIQDISDESWGIDNVGVRLSADLTVTTIRGSTLPADGSTNATAVDRIVVYPSRDLNAESAVEAVHYVLREAGGNGVLGDGDDGILDLAPTLTSSRALTFAFNDSPLQPGTYRFELRNTLLDVAGNPVAPFSRQFTIVNPLLGRIENTFNNQLESATTLTPVETPAVSGFLTAAGVGSFPSGGDTDYWRFTAEAGDRVTAWIETDTAGVYPQIYLRNAANGALSNSGEWQPSYNYFQNFAITVPGDYYLAVVANNGRNRGNYVLRLDVSRRLQLETEDNNAPSQATTLQLTITPGLFRGRVAGTLPVQDGSGDYYRLPLLNIGNTVSVGLGLPQTSSLATNDVALILELEGTGPVATNTTGLLTHVVNGEGVYFLRVATLKPGWRAQYLVDVTIADGTRPSITSIGLPEEGSSKIDLIDRFTLGFSEDMNPAIGLIGTRSVVFGGHTYVPTTGTMTWWQAEDQAVSYGGHLVAVNDAAENDMLLREFGGYVNFWLGFTDEALEGTFVWSSGEEVTFTSWNGGEPNNFNGEHFAEFLSSGRWNDAPGGGVRWGVIEFASSTDTDGDGVTDPADAFPQDPFNGVDLRAAGTDGQFGTPDDQVYRLASTGYSSGLSATFRVVDGPLQPGDYRLTLTTYLQDRAGNGLGAAVVRQFSILPVSGFLVENRGNNSSATATSLSTSATGGSDGSISAFSSYGVGQHPYHVIAVRMNGDTALDVVSSDYTDAGIRVALGDGRGGFTSVRRYAAGSGVVAAAAGDFNGDGRMDVATANHTAHTVGVFLADNAGGLLDMVTYAGVSYPRDLVAEDLNDDGKLDLAVACWGNNTVAILLGNGDGTFADAVTYPSGNGPHGIAVGDVTGDGEYDLVVPNYHVAMIAVLPGDGTGVFGAPVTYAVGSTPRTVGVGDLNGDTRMDVVSLNVGDNSVGVLLGQADGTLGAQTAFSDGVSDAYDMVLHDMNGDGQLDVVVAGYGSSRVAILNGVGDGTLRAVNTYSFGGNPIAIAPGDFTGDGIQDLAMASHNWQAVILARGNNLEPLTEDPAGSGFRTASGRGKLAEHEDVDYWSFTAQAGDTLSVAVEIPGNPGASQLYYWIEYPDGVVLADFVANSYNGWGQSTPVTIPATGTYYLRVRYNYDYFGEYRVRVSLARPPIGFETEDNNNVSQADAVGLTLDGNRQVGTMAGYVGVYDGYGDFFAMGNLAEGTTINLRARQPSSSGLVPFLSVHDSAGAMVAHSNPGQTTLSHPITAGTDGAFYARINAARPGVLSFDGENDRVYAGYWNAGSTWTLEAWVKPSAAPAGRRSIAGCFNSCLDWGITMQDGEFGVVIRPPGGCSQTYRSGEPVELDRWYHVMGTCDGTNATLYVNGVLKITGPVEQNYVGTTSYFVIGSESCCGQNSFPGQMDNVRVWNRALTDQEAAAFATDQNLLFSGREAGLIGYWPFDEGWGGVAFDLSTAARHASLENGASWVPSTPEPPYPSLVTQYLLDVELADLTAPRIVSDTLPVEGSTNLIVMDRFNLGFSEDMIAATVTSSASYDLRATGADNTYGTEDDDVYTVVCTGYTGGLGAGYVVSDGPLQPGAYRFTARTSLKDRAANGLAVDYVRTFTIEAVPGFGLENRNNASPATSTTMGATRLGTPDGSFASVQAKAVGVNPYHILAADLNGDGRPDLVTANISSDNLSVLLGQTGGTFADQVQYTAGNGPIAVAAGDLNADGKLDLVSANYYGNTLGVLLGNGDGTLQAAVQYPCGANPRQIRVTDLNADGKLDVVTANMGNHNLSVFFGNGDGTLADRVNYAVQSSPYGVDVGDLNGDTRPDLIAANTGSDSLTVLLNNGDGTFGAGVHYSTPGSPREVVLGDMNGDGQPDAVVLNAGANSVSVFPGNADGTLGAGTAYPTGGSDPYHMILANLNGDARPDVAVGSYGNSRMILFQNLGDGSLGPAVQYLVPNNPIAVASGDFNGDGRMDLATANHTGNHIWIWFGNDTELLTEDPAGSGLRTGTGRGNIANTGDNDFWSFTADANDRLSVAIEVPGAGNATGLYVRIEQADGQDLTEFGANYYGWGQSTPLVLPTRGTYHVRVTYNYNYFAEYRLRVSLARPPVQIETENNNSLGEANSPALPLNGNRQQATVLGYVGIGDGNGDYYRLGNFTEGTTITLTTRKPATSALSQVLSIYRSSGTLVTNSLPGEASLIYDIEPGAADTFYARIHADAGSAGILSQYLLDIDVADIRPPFITSLSLPAADSTTTAIWDRFSMAFSEDMTASTVTSLASYDLRAAGTDGQFDTSDDAVYVVASTGYTSGLSSGYSITDGPLQAGSYRFTAKVSLQDRAGNGLSQPYVRLFTVGDVPGYLAENRDNGSMLGATSLSRARNGSPDSSVTLRQTQGVGNNPYGVAAGDLNNDGKPDIVSANISSDSVSVLLGNGDGTLATQVAYPAGNGPIAVALGDFNADGRLDVVSANHYNHTLAVLLGNGDGTLQARTDYATGNNPRAVRIADFNADGRLDLVSANYSHNNVSVFLGNGDGTFQARVNYATGNGCFGVAVGDVNGDGKPDLAAVSQDVDRGSVLLGNGDGTFAAAVQYDLQDGPRDVELGDMDGDGRLDLVALNAHANSVTVLRGNGDGTFGAAQHYPTGGSDPYHLELIQLNGDARPDVAVASYGSSRLILFVNNGDGTLGQRLHLAGVNNPIDVVAGDFNRDGIQDLATANYTQQTVGIWLGNDSEPLAEDPAGSGLRTGFGRGNITSTSDVDYWSFSARAGDRLSVAVDNIGNPNSSGIYYRVQYSDGTDLTEFAANPAGYGQSSPVVIPASGTYRIRVSYNYQYFQEYRIRVALVPGPREIEVEDNNNLSQANLLAYGLTGHQRSASRFGYIGVADRAGDYYALGNLSAGTRIDLSQVQPAYGGFGAVMAILNGAGNVLANSLPTENTLQFTAPADAAYYASYNYVMLQGARHPGGSAVSLYFDGSDDYIEVPLNVPESAMTVSLWFRTVTPNVGLFSVLGGGHDRHIYLTGGNLACRVYNAGTISSTGLTLTDGQWHQAVMTFGAAIGGTRLYLDGNLVASSTKANSDFTWQTAIRIGYSDDAPQRNFDGVLDDVRIWNSAFTPEEVTTNFGNTLTGGEPGLLSWYRLNDGAGTVATDSGPTPVHGTVVGATWTAEGSAVSVPRGLLSSYLLDFGLLDTSGPNITSLNLPAEGTTNAFVWPHFVVGFSEDMMPATVVNLANYELRGAGVDGAFGSGDDVLFALISQGYDRGLTASFSITDGPLPPDQYRFTIRTGLQDAAANPLVAPYERNFHVVGLPGYALESRSNNTDGTGTPLKPNPAGPPSGSFNSVFTTPVGTQPYFVVSGHLNGDAHLDVVSANYGTDDISVLLGNGDGTFQPAVDYASGNGAIHVALADVDHDNKLDVIVANHGVHTVSVFPGNGDGTLGAKVTYAVANNPNAVEARDLNGDGWADLVTANRTGDSISVLMNNADGTFAARVNYPTADGSARLAFGEFNGDNRTDVAVANYEGDSYSILLGNGDGTFQPATTQAAGDGPYSVDVADLNGDGKQDLVLALIFAHQLSFSPGNGDGTFGAAVNWASGGNQPHLVQLRDVNLDGRLDAVVANYQSSILSVHLGATGGTFLPPQNYGSGGNVLGTAVADYNEDGRPDIAVVNYSGRTLGVFLGEKAEPLPEDALGLVRIGGGRGHIYDNSDVDYFTFSGVAGDQVVVGVEAPGFPGSSGLYYVLYQPDGRVATEFAANSSTWGQSDPVTLPMDGTYSVRVSRNYNYYGEYRFRVFSVRPPTVLENEDNNNLSQANGLNLQENGDARVGTAIGYVRFNGDLDYYNLGTLTNGSTVFLNARPTAGSPLAPIVSLYDASNGYMIEAGGGRAFDSVAEIRITRTGIYYALVRGPDGTTGLNSSYRLDVQVVPTGSVSFPNLLVTTVTPPSGSGIRSGQSINFSFTVQNAGSVGTGGSGWLDRVLMTANQIVGDADDIQLAVIPRVGALASGDSYSAEGSGTIPPGVAGVFYIAVQTDYGDAVNEFVLEGDNATFSESTFNVTRPPYPDLKVEGLTVTGPDEQNRYAIAWTTANRGTAPANGGFNERLLVRNQTTGLVLVNSDRPVASDLAPDATLVQSAEVTATAAGRYQVVVITDTQDRFFEFDAIGHVTAEQNSAEASFQITQLFTITLAAQPAAGGQALGAGRFPVGSTITVTAVPDTSALPYRFQNWTENGVFQSGSSAYAFVVTRDRTLTANFSLPLYQIGAANDPAAGGFVTGAGSYFHAANVTLTAHPATGYVFTNWTEAGSVVGLAPILSFPAAANRSLVAHYFEANTFHDVTLATDPAGLATLAGAGRYNNGQSLEIIAPGSITNPPLVFTFRHLRQNDNVVSTRTNYTKTFSTADPTNVTFTAVYDSRNIAPLVTNVVGGVSNAVLARLVPVDPVPISANFQVLLQFDRSMNPATEPIFVVSNVTANAVQAVVPTGGTWSRSVTPNDTYVCPAISFTAAMDGRHEVWVSAARDPAGVALESTRVLSFVVDAVVPPNPVVTLGPVNNTSATVEWTGYAAPADLNGFRVYLQDTTFSSVAGLTLRTRLGAASRAYAYTGLELDRNYFGAIVAVDNAGNFNPNVTAVLVRLASTVPPAVAVQVAPAGADTARIDWAGYNTSGLIGFTGFRLYYQEAPFTSVAGLTPAGSFGTEIRSAEVSGLDRTRTYYFAVVGFNRNGEFNPNVTTGSWSDPFGGDIRFNTAIGGPGQVVEIYQSMNVVGGATLTVRAGTTLRFVPESTLTITQGRLVVEGTALDPVVFTSYFDATGETPSPGDWNGMVLQPGSAGSTVRHLVVRYGRGLTVNGAGITLEAYTGNRNLGSGLTVAQGATLTTTEALLTYNETGVRQTDTARLTLTGSVLKNNAAHARGDGSNPLIATGNWWGTPNDAEIAPLVTGSVNRGNPLLSEPILTPAIGIVGGDTSLGRREIVLRLASRTAEDMRVSEDSAYLGVFFEPFAATRPFTLSEGGGQKVVFAQFRSITGQTNPPVTLTLNYITAGPVIQLFSLAEGQVLPRPLTVTGQASALLGMQTLEFQVDGTPLATQAGGSLSHYFDVRLLPDGIHRVKLLARDQSGNIATAERNVIIGITPPPAPVITSPAGDITVTIPTLAVAGNAEPFVPVRLTRNGLTVGATTASAVGKVNFADIPLIEGVNELVAVAADAVGTTRSVPRQVVLDSGAPVPLVLDAPVYRPGQGLEFAWRFGPEGERASRFRLYWHTAPFANPAGATGQSPMLENMNFLVRGLANGAHHFAVVGYDAAGNASPLSNLVPFTYDGLVPTFQVAFDKASPVGVGDVHLTLTASEVLRETPGLTIRPPGLAPVSINLTPGENNTYTGTFAVLPEMPSGVARLNVSGRDTPGNEFQGAPAGADLVVDTLAPQGRVSVTPTAPIQTLAPADVNVTLTLTEVPKTGTQPTLQFAPPTGAPVAVALTGEGTNWIGVLSLGSAMGSGFGTFELAVRDAVENLGTNLLDGKTLEIYNTLIPTPPEEPTGLAATALPGGGVRLSWNRVGNAEIYRLYREPGADGEPAILALDGITSLTLTNLPDADGPYRFAIAASRRGADSTHTNTVVAVSDRTAPPAPVEVQAQLAAAGVRVTWRQPDGETPRQFRVYRNDTLIRTVSIVTPVSDSPPRGIANYVVAAVDATGNESRSDAATIELFVGAVSDLTVLVNGGQAPALSWTSGDPTTTGYNVYRNNTKLNVAPIVERNFTDASSAGFGVVQYAVRALNAAGQESPARAVDVFRVALSLLANPDAGVSRPLVTRYFDVLQAGVRNLASEGSLPLRQIELRRLVGNTERNLVEPVGQGLAAGASLSRNLVLPSANNSAPQTFRVRAIQETDIGGSSVIYQDIVEFRGADAPSVMVEVIANDLPLAGGFSAFDVRMHNRGFADMDVILTRGAGRDPGDVFVSVKNGQGEEVSRAYFNGIVPGVQFRPNGNAFIRVRPGASFRVTVPNVLVPEALAAAPAVTFEGGSEIVYWHYDGAEELESGPVTGTMNTSLRQTDYFGTLSTDRQIYPNDTSVIITGQAISRANRLPVPNAALKIGFTTRGFTWYRETVTDAEGNYRYVYEAPPGLSGSLTLWAAHPDVFDRLNQAEVIFYRIYANPPRGDIRMSKNDTLDFQISLKNPGNLPLENLTTTFRAFRRVGELEEPVATVQGTNLTDGPLSLAAGETRGIPLRLHADIDAPNDCTVEFVFQSAEGAQASFTGVTTLLPAVPVLSVVEPRNGYVEVGVDRGGLVSRTVTIANNGLRDLLGVELLPPTNVTWMQINLMPSPDGRLRLPDLPVGQTFSFTVVFTPPSDTAMDYYRDYATIRGINSVQDFRINLYALVTSAERGSAQFFVDNVLGQKVPNAAVRLRNTLLQVELPPAYTDAEGLVTVGDLQEGHWSWQVNAAGHSSTVGSVEVIPDQTVQISTRLSKSLVTVNFRVEPVPYTDRYEIRIEQTFETHVPAPVLILNPVNFSFDYVMPGFETNFVVTGRNHGLIEMTDVEIHPASAGGGRLIPLITYFPVLRPQEVIEIPYRVVYLGENAGEEGGGSVGGIGPDGLKAKLAQTADAGKEGGKERGYPNWADAVDCTFGGFVETAQAVLALNSLINAEYRCISDASLVRTAQGILVAFTFVDAIGKFANPVQFLANAISCFMRQILGDLFSGMFGDGGRGSGRGGGDNSGQRSIADFSFSGPACFGPGTPVLMSDGRLRPIEAIQVHDVVRSGRRSGDLATVSEVHVRTVDATRVIRYGVAQGAPREEELITTDEHLFWVDGKGWTEARAIRKGDWLITDKGARAEVRSAETRAGPLRVHTFKTREDHAFYANGILVHDMCGRLDAAGSTPAAAKEVQP